MRAESRTNINRPVLPAPIRVFCLDISATHQPRFLFSRENHTIVLDNPTKNKMSAEGIYFQPDTDIPSLERKVILITGTNSGLGKQASLALAKHHPALIWMTARSPEKASEAISHVKAQVPGAAVAPLELDLSSFDSIKAAARTVLATSPRLDILMLNAGRKRIPLRCGLSRHDKCQCEKGCCAMDTTRATPALRIHFLPPLESLLTCDRPDSNGLPAGADQRGVRDPDG